MKPTILIAGLVLLLGIGGILGYNSARTPSSNSEGMTAGPSEALVASMRSNEPTGFACCHKCPGPCPAADESEQRILVAPPPENARSGK